MVCLNLFLVHTPLQVLSATNLTVQYKIQDAVLIYEGANLKTLVVDSLWLETHQGQQSRTVTHNPAKAIKQNLAILSDILLKHQPEKVKLYISELQWMCNKAFYSILKTRFPNSIEVSFFDEGLHFYINNKNFSEETKIKTWAKYFWMRFHGLPSIHKFTYQFYKEKIVRSLYAYHPNLFTPELYANANVLKLDAQHIRDYMREISTLTQPIGSTKQMLFLSQAYYWDIPESEFKKVIADMIRYFQSKGVEQFYLKPHHSDKSSWIDYLTHELGFITAELPQNTPIEVYAQQLNFQYIVSVSSSALLNLQAFGFKGQAVSFGMNRCSLTQKYCQIHQKLLPIFKSEGVDIID